MAEWLLCVSGSIYVQRLTSNSLAALLMKEMSWISVASMLSSSIAANESKTMNVLLNDILIKYISMYFSE